MKKSLRDLQHQQLKSKTGEEFSLSAILSEAFGLQDLFIHHEILGPGKKTSAPHAHSQREEFFYVLLGIATVHSSGGSRELNPGDYIGFRPGNVHWVENHSSSEVQLLVIASNPQGDKVIYE